MLTLYRIFTFLIYYLAFPYTFLSHIFGSKKWRERLGYFQSIDSAFDGRRAERKNQKTIWLHASSMGEIRVLSILADELISRSRARSGRLTDKNNNISLFITVMTEAGYQSAISLSRNRWLTSFLPLDYHSPVKRFLNKVKPSAAVFIETEIWPNIAIELGKRQIPIFLANGRLSEKSARRYRWFKSGLSKIFGNYKKIMVQSDKDKERYIKIGADESKIEVLRSLKFDAPVIQMPPEENNRLRKALPFNSGRKIFIAGSTRNGENEIILRIFKKLQAEIADVRLILVPRHLDRIDELSAKMESHGLSFVRYTQLPVKSEKAIVVVDRMGILNDLYHVSNIAFVGGTLVELGGHNILEPVWAGIPVLFGPSIFNVEDSAAYITKNGFGEMIETESELLKKIQTFLAGQKQYRKKGASSEEPSYSRLTAKIILDNINTDGKNLAKSNQK